MEDNLKTVGEQDSSDPWHDDILDRRGFADFLSRVLVEQSCTISERQRRGLTVALDAEWGAGKTFFIERWADSLRKQGYPIVRFDAWKHDLGELPSIALMAAINEALREWLGQTTVQAETKEKALVLGRKGIRMLRRAVLPTTGVVLTGLFKKATGIAWNDLKGAYAGVDDEDDDAESTSAEIERADSDDQAKIDASLDRIFEKALGEQTQRIEAIGNFRVEIGRIIDLIHAEAAAKMPVFVFVDELDRCRPSYSIALLEEIKHIFGMPKVCFVVSTNLTQLSHSVCAVYGQSFDAEQYLKRFFDYTFALPMAQIRQHVEMLFSEHAVFRNRNTISGLPRSYRAPSFPRSEDEYDLDVEIVVLIFRCFDLDMRSQKQAFGIASLAASALDERFTIHLPWLFFLSSVMHKSQEAFFEIDGKDFDTKSFAEFAKKLMKQDKEIIFNEQGRIRKILTTELILKYYMWSGSSLQNLMLSANTSEKDYPGEIIFEFLDESNVHTNVIIPRVPSIMFYPKMVRYAGYHLNQVDFL